MNQAPTNAVRPAYADWLQNTNNITSMFLAAGQIPGLINLAGGLPEPDIYPVKSLSKLATQAISDHPDDALTYTAIEGLPALRDCIAQRFTTGSLQLTRDNILITSGGMQGLDLIGKVLLNTGDTIAAQSPAYLGALDAWRPRMPEYYPMELASDDFSETIALTNTKFGYVVPNFSNPTGQLISLAQRKRFADAALSTNTWLIEDDPYGTLYYDSTPLERIIDITASQRPGIYDGPVIYVGTLSKQLVPGLRVGWIIASAEMIKALTLAKQGSDMSTSGLCQRMTLDALEQRLDQEILPDILNVYRTRRDALCAAMNKHLTSWFDWEVPVGGMFVWATAKDPSLDTDKLLGAAMDEKVCITPSSVFDPMGINRRSIRINFSRNAPEQLDEGVRRLALATKSLLAR